MPGERGGVVHATTTAARERRIRLDQALEMADILHRIGVERLALTRRRPGRLVSDTSR